ncbi:hypothetical protein [Propioniciclava flava]
MSAREVLQRGRDSALKSASPKRIATIAVCVLAWLTMAVCATASPGATTCRPARTTDLVGLVRAETDRSDALRKRGQRPSRTRLTT